MTESEDKDTKIDELAKEVAVEKDRADRLLARINEMELQRKMLADFLWPVYKDYLSADPMSIQIQQKRVNISINKVREPIRFEEDSAEGAIVKLVRMGRLDQFLTARSVKNRLTEAGYGFDEGTVRTALDRLVMSPFHLIDKTKGTDRSWKYRTNREEAQDAFRSFDNEKSAL